MLSAWQRPLRFGGLSRSRPLSAITPAGHDLAHLLATTRSNSARAILVLKRIERGPHHIVGIGGADRFGDDILNAQRFENRAHRTTCDDAGAGRRGTQKHTAGAMVTVNVMMKRTALAQRDADQI